MPTRDALATDAVLSLASFTSESLMVPSLVERDPAGIIAELSQILQRDCCIPDLLPFYNAVVNREFLTSTAVERSMAFPHARMGGIKQLAFAVGKTAEPIAWGRTGSAPVQLVFLIAIPATESTHYLHLISGLARLSNETPLLTEIIRAKEPREMFESLKRIKLRLGRS